MPTSATTFTQTPSTIKSRVHNYSEKALALAKRDGIQDYCTISARMIFTTFPAIFTINDDKFWVL
jgi:hypothetical protein